MPRYLHKKRSLITSFKHAISGLAYILYSQRNIQIHVGMAIASILLGIVLGIPSSDWCILLLSISLVLITEGLNTSLEVSVDLTTRKRKYRAMLSKDVAAGCVLIAAINALIMGYLIFFDRLVTLFLGGLPLF